MSNKLKNLMEEGPSRLEKNRGYSFKSLDVVPSIQHDPSPTEIVIKDISGQMEETLQALVNSNMRPDELKLLIDFTKNHKGLISLLKAIQPYDADALYHLLSDEKVFRLLKLKMVLLINWITDKDSFRFLFIMLRDVFRKIRYPSERNLNQ